MFITDLGSEAYQSIYDRLQLDEELMKNTRVDKDAPLTIRRVESPRVDAILELRELIDQEIFTWLKLVADQEGGRHDVEKIDAAFNKKLSQRGTLQKALES